MNSLPVELVNYVLEFQGYHVFRHGKFMKRISPEDERYAVLMSKPQIETNTSWFSPVPIEYHTNFRRKLENTQYQFNISVMILENAEIYWFMYVKEKYPEKGMIGSNWGMCKRKCVSYRLYN